MSRSVKIALITGIAVIGLVVGIAAAMLRGDRIYPGVRISGADLSNMTVVQAERRISLLAVDVTSRRVVLRYAGESMTVPLGDLGARVDVVASAQSAHRIGRQGGILHRLGEVIGARRRPIDLPLAFEFDDGTATAFLRQTARKIDRLPENARPIVSEDVVSIRPERPGIRLSLDKSLTRIADVVNSGREEAELVVETAQPNVKASDLEGIDGIIGSYSTPYKPWERDRSYNLRLACRAIDGTLLKPGEVFSYNKIVGPRDRKLGFRDAHIFVKGKVESGTGGGVCQVSTTVYNAALLSNLQILRRSHHSRPVVYAPVGRDATVAPSIDFRFRNNTDAPIYITASLGSSRVHITMYGREVDGREVEIVSSGHSVIGYKAIEQVDDSLEPGKKVVKQDGRSGHRVSIYRVVKDYGQVTSRELISNDYYAPESRIVVVSEPVQM